MHLHLSTDKFFFLETAVREAPTVVNVMWHYLHISFIDVRTKEDTKCLGGALVSEDYH
jgi:hypothetical protein